MTRVVLTAGYDRAAHVVALAELLRRDGVAVAGALVVRVTGVRRLRAYARQRGMGFLWSALRRLLGPAGSDGSPLAAFLQRNAVEERSLRHWCGRHDVPYRTVASLDDARSLAFLHSVRADGVLYGGGGILHAPFIGAARGRILNAHHGPLPAVRGMNACEWSLLLGEAPAVSVHFVERGIDTGPVVETLPLVVAPGTTLARLREECTVAGIEGLRRNVGALLAPPPPPHPAREAQRQVYVLAPALREILERRLASRPRADPAALQRPVTGH